MRHNQAIQIFFKLGLKFEKLEANVNVQDTIKAVFHSIISLSPTILAKPLISNI